MLHQTAGAQRFADVMTILIPAGSISHDYILPEASSSHLQAIFGLGYHYNNISLTSIPIRELHFSVEPNYFLDQDVVKLPMAS